VKAPAYDDITLPGALATLVLRFVDYPIHWAIGQADDLTPDGTRVPYESALPYGLLPAGRVNAWATEHGGNWPIHCAGLMMRTACLRALGGWVASPADDDVAMFAALSELADGYNEPTVTWLYRHHPEQTHRTPEWRVEHSGAAYRSSTGCRRPGDWVVCLSRAVALLRRRRHCVR